MSGDEVGEVRELTRLQRERNAALAAALAARRALPRPAVREWSWWDRVVFLVTGRPSRRVVENRRLLLAFDEAQRGLLGAETTIRVPPPVVHDDDFRVRVGPELVRLRPGSPGDREER